MLKEICGKLFYGLKESQIFMEIWGTWEGVQVTAQQPHLEPFLPQC